MFRKLILFCCFFIAANFLPVWPFHESASLANETPEPVCLRVATFNIQILGQTKMRHPLVSAMLVRLLSKFDLVAIQELRDKQKRTMPKLVNMLNTGPVRYTWVESPRLGRGRVKEQMVFLFRKARLTPRVHRVWSNPKKTFSRPPFFAKFLVDEMFEVEMMNIHVAPQEANFEIKRLGEILHDDFFPDILMGDFNADCSYYNRDHISNDIPGFLWPLPPDEDSSVAKSKCLYDRIALRKGSPWKMKEGPYTLRFDSAEYMMPPEMDEALREKYPVYASILERAGLRNIILRKKKKGQNPKAEETVFTPEQVARAARKVSDHYPVAARICRLPAENQADSGTQP